MTNISSPYVSNIFLVALIRKSLKFGKSFIVNEYGFAWHVYRSSLFSLRIFVIRVINTLFRFLMQISTCVWISRIDFELSSDIQRFSIISSLFLDVCIYPSKLFIISINLALVRFVSLKGSSLWVSFSKLLIIVFISL